MIQTVPLRDPIDLNKRQKHTYILTHGDADGIAAGAIRAKNMPDEDNITISTGGKFDMNLASAAYEHIKGLFGVAEKMKQDEGIFARMADKIMAQAIPDEIYIQDVPLPKNRDGIFWLQTIPHTKIHFVDHHESDGLENRVNPHLSSTTTYNINTDRNTSTADLVNTEYNNSHPEWAIVGLSGDRIKKRAQELAGTTEINDEAYKRLEQLGVALNYNSFSQDKEPIELLIQACEQDAVEMGADSTIKNLLDNRTQGLATIDKTPIYSADNLDVLLLEDSDTARGLFADIAYAQQETAPHKYHAIIVPKHETENTRYDVSLRGPKNTGALAQTLGGGGRETAGGAGTNMSVDEIVQTLQASEVYK